MQIMQVSVGHCLNALVYSNPLPTRPPQQPIDLRSKVRNIDR